MLQETIPRHNPPEARVCPCHGETVTGQLKFDSYGEPRVTTLCSVDGFDLGYGGWVRLSDYQRRQREIATARICTAPGCGRAMDNDHRCNWCGKAVS